MSHSTEASIADINHRFTDHPASAVRATEHKSVRLTFRELAHFIDHNVPNGREKATALTHLETSMFWANAGIARQGN